MNFKEGIYKRATNKGLKYMVLDHYAHPPHCVHPDCLERRMRIYLTLLKLWLFNLRARIFITRGKL